MKSKLAYVQELKDLTLDLEEAVMEKDEAKIEEILSLSEAILSDIREAGYTE